MAEGIIDAFEVVKIDEHQPAQFVMPPGAFQRPLEIVLKHDPVGQAGEKVMIGQTVDLFVGLLQVPAHLRKGAGQVAYLIARAVVNADGQVAAAHFRGRISEADDRGDNHLSAEVVQKCRDDDQGADGGDTDGQAQSVAGGIEIFFRNFGHQQEGILDLPAEHQECPLLVSDFRGCAALDMFGQLVQERVRQGGNGRTRARGKQYIAVSVKQLVCRAIFIPGLGKPFFNKIEIDRYRQIAA